MNSLTVAEVVNIWLGLSYIIAAPLALIFITYGCVMIMTSQGDEMQVRKGFYFVKKAIVGLLFTMFGVFIVAIIAARILRIPF